MLPLPIAFRGASFFIQNVCEFGRAGSVDLDAEKPDLFGVSMESFLSGAWRDAAGQISAEHWLTQVPEDVAALARRHQCIILFDMSNEGPAFMEDRLEAMHAALDRRRISPKSCVLLQQNRRLPADYRDWAQRVGVQPMTSLCYDYYPRRMAGLLARSGGAYQPNTSMRERVFLCPNFTPKAHRVSLVSWLLAENLNESGFISFHVENKNDASNTLQLSSDFPNEELTLVARGLTILKERAPLIIDSTDSRSVNYEFSMVPEHFYDESYFSVVSDSNVSRDVFRFTEKLIKPLAMNHPLIVIGFPHTLHLLKGFGFRTFGEMFDESYDSIEAPERRIKAVLHELRRVFDQDRATLHETYVRMRDTLDHNARVARTLLDSSYRMSLDGEILNEIMRYHCGYADLGA